MTQMLIEKIKSIICYFKGHNYPTGNGCIDNYHLLFCHRCNKEMYNRTFNDIEPMTEEMQEIDEMYNEQ